MDFLPETGCSIPADIGIFSGYSAKDDYQSAGYASYERFNRIQSERAARAPWRCR
jgi:hypothetical protein